MSTRENETFKANCIQYKHIGVCTLHFISVLGLNLAETNSEIRRRLASAR